MKNTLKWLCLLPAALAASVLVFAIGSLIGYISTRMFVLGGNGRWIWAVSRLAANIFAGYVFVYVGTIIAPKYKKQSALALTAIVLVLVTVGITLQLVLHLTSGFWEQVEVYLGSILTFIGAISGYESIKKDEELST